MGQDGSAISIFHDPTLIGFPDVIACDGIVVTYRRVESPVEARTACRVVPALLADAAVMDWAAIVSLRPDVSPSALAKSPESTTTEPRDRAAIPA